MKILVPILMLTGIAAADPAKELAARLKFQREIKHDAPAFAIADNTLLQYPPDADHWPTSRADKVVVGTSADRNVAWLASDLTVFEECVDPEDLGPDSMGDPFACGPKKSVIEDEDGFKYTPVGFLHATMVWEKRKGQWQPLAWHLSTPATAKQQAAARKRSTTPPVIENTAAPAAAEAVKLFGNALADAKVLAAVVADRRDAVLYGSEPTERYVGSAAVKKQLAKWGLSLKVRDGHASGVSANGAVAWVAANVDATHPKLKTTPYRLFTVWEKGDTTWRIVQIHFSYYRAP